MFLFICPWGQSSVPPPQSRCFPSFSSFNFYTYRYLNRFHIKKKLEIFFSFRVWLISHSMIISSPIHLTNDILLFFYCSCVKFQCVCYILFIVSIFTCSLQFFVISENFQYFMRLSCLLLTVWARAGPMMFLTTQRSPRGFWTHNSSTSAFPGLRLQRNTTTPG